MALERQSIEKKFPIGLRGYDPDAVDAHLSQVAGDVEEFKRSARRRSETLASAASEQVRAIVQAAENSAAEIQRQAEEEAREIKAEASAEAQATREDAIAQAREYVGKVSESTSILLQRLDAMDGELGGLIEALRSGANRLDADLKLLEGNLVDMQEAVRPRPQFEPMPDEPAAGQSHTEAEAVNEASVDGGDAALAHNEPLDNGAPRPLVDAGEETDAEGARLIALNMALNGTPREETDRYLAENFQLADRGGLLDEVYSSLEG